MVIVVYAPHTLCLGCTCTCYTGIPTLVILDKEGKLVTGSGRAAVCTDPDGLVCHVLYMFHNHRVTRYSVVMCG